MTFTTPAAVFVLSTLAIFFPDSITGCGGELKDKSGTITSPIYPANYPNNAVCNWTIVAAVGEIIDLRFSKLDLDGYSDSCPDVVTVFDGDGPSTASITRLCRLKTQTELQGLFIRSTGNKMHITFTSDGVNTRQGFLATYWTQACPQWKYGRDLCNATCSCVVNNSWACSNFNGSCACKQGWTGSDCSTDINECTASRTEICPSYQNCVNAPGSFSCQCSEGLVKNVTTGECQVNPTLRCNVNGCSHLCVKLPANNSPICYCPDDTTLIGNTCQACPTLKYGKNCSKTCNCNSGHGRCDPQTGGCICNTGWTSADCSRDVDECADTLISSICTRGGMSCMNTLGSYECVCRKGFELATNQSCVPINCKNIINQATSGTIQSPYYPDTYWPNANCSWTIRSTASNKISLRVSNLPDECSTSYYLDYIDVYDGEDATAPWLGRYCQQKPPLATIRSTGNTMHIAFISDGSVQRSFLNGTYLAFDYPSCKQTWAINQTQQVIQSPGYPGYRNNTFCYWLITGTYGNTISLRVKNLNIDSQGKTFLAVYDGRHAGNSLIGKYFGTWMPALIRSSGLSMYIVFQSEASVDGTGFNGTVHAQNCSAFFYGQEECNIPCRCVRTNTRSCDNINGTCSCQPGWRSSDCSVDVDECSENPSLCTKTEKCINTPGSYYCQPDCNKDFSGNGIIETKDYPNIPLNRASCNFTIMGNPGTVVTLMIASEDFNLIESASCTIDNLEVYSSQNVTANQLIGKYCGTRLPNIIRSTNRAMLLKLTTYAYNSRRGFRGQFYTHPCPDFRYGTTCQFPCTCHQSRTQFCDNTNGVCVCKTGWMGDDCSEDVNECRFPKCAVNEVCQNLPGSFNCSCKNGFTKNASGLCVSSRTNCTTKIKDACSHSCYFDGINRKDTCSCPDGLELGSTPNTKYNCVIPYYPYGQSAGDLNLSSSSDKAGHSYRSNAIVFTSPVPFGTSLKTEAYVFSNGLIGFDKIEVSEEPDLQAASAQKIDLISAFWSKVDSAKGQVFYHLYEKCGPSDFNEAGGSTANSPHKTQVFERAAADVKQKTGLYDFDVNTVLVVTWQDLRPLDQTTIAESNTFQAVYISGNAQEKITDQGFSDVETAYVYFIYQKGQMRWQYKIGRKTEIGYVAKPYATTNSVQITDKSFSLNEANYLESIMLEVARHTSPVQKCKNHVCKNSRLINNFAYRAEIQELYNCPCTVGQLGLQWMFFENRGHDIYCYAISAVAKRRLLPSNPRNKLCCYKWRQPPSGSTWETWAESIAVSSFIHNTADAGHVLVGDREWFKGVQDNLNAHQWCCKDSQESKMCSRFNSIYPDFQCTYDVTFVPAYLLGDPHIVTFDNKTYTMNGLAEYILMDVQSVNFTLQARTGKVKTSQGVFTNATVFTAFAAKEGNARFQVELSVDKKTMLIYVDGINYTADFYKNASFRLTREEIDISRDNRFNKTKVSALFPSNVIVQVNVGVDCLELNLEVDKALRGKTRGLLGNFNGRADDEFLLPNGTVLPANMTEEQIYKNFAIAYQVTSSTTVFTYANGMTAANYTEPGYTPIFRSSLNPSAALLKNATDFCGVGQELCVYDYLVTGDTRFAQNTKTTQALSIASRKTLENNVPNITINESSSRFTNKRWFVQEGVINTLRFTATDKDGDLLTYLLDGSPRGASINQSGVLTYTPNSLEPVSINVRVKDTKNGYSPIIYLPLLICPRCNNRGICDLNSTRKIEYFDGLVQILKCACSPGYVGDSCESEKDACKSKPCSRGQNCTDLTAAQQGNSLIGYECGTCPAGFEDFKGRCVDKDECNGTQVCDQICTNTEGSYLCSCNDGFIVSGLNPRACLVKNCSNRCLPENTLYCNESISKCVCKSGITTDDCSVVNSCLDNPCPNDLLCKPNGNRFECVCKNGLPQTVQKRCIDCNRTLTEASGKLMSTNYPANYPDQSYCTWTIVSGEANAIITLNITDFDVEGCPFDYLEVYDGNSSRSNMIGQYCEEVPKTIVSSGNALHVVFTSDDSVNLRGFIASYVAESRCRTKRCSHTCTVVSTSPRVETCVCPPWTRLNPRNDSQCLAINACNTTITNGSGYIVSPDYPQNYPANVTCSWNIPASPNTVISLSFSDMDMEGAGTNCPYDSLTVFRGSSVGTGTVLGKFCGSVTPQDMILTGAAGMLLVFQSDATLFGRGFKAQFSITTSPVIPVTNRPIA
ncbi:unnamed protein product [Lymnaea stagnalis]|uniref:Cubilin n=1 Tax=Lymnaea stagnalis TaxID=6523 RepID=A0AAV2HMX3_LYMST